MYYLINIWWGIIQKPLCSLDGLLRDWNENTEKRNSGFFASGADIRRCKNLQRANCNSAEKSKSLLFNYYVWRCCLFEMQSCTMFSVRSFSAFFFRTQFRYSKQKKLFLLVHIAKSCSYFNLINYVYCLFSFYWTSSSFTIHNTSSELCDKSKTPSIKMCWNDFAQ